MDLFRVAVVQAGSVPFDRERSTVKALDLTGQAIRSGARLIVFPEAFISGYPKGADFGTRVGMRSPEGRKWFRSACGRRCYLHLIKGHDSSRRETGQHMSHFIISGGPYARAYAKLAASGFKLHWESPPGKKAKRKNESKTKFTCPRCRQNAWARTSANLDCGDCGERMRSAGEEIPPAVYAIVG
jgi:hypothetical protein